MGQYGTIGLRTIADDGTVPECRMRDARDTQDWVRRLVDNDARRSWKRSRVNGLVDGNPPYKQAKLREAGRADACNVNWGTGRSYLESGSGSFYDLSSEAPSVITFRTSHGSDEEKETWSNIASKEADLLFKSDKVWDFQMQISQWDMVLHGCGPFFFEDAYQVFPRAVLCGDLKVPEFTKSDTKYWEGGFIQCTYYPPELYKFIQDEKSATAVGWNVKYTKKVIENAMDILRQGNIQYDWEFYQQQLKNNSLSYYDDSKVCRLAHVFWQEFDGRITHAIVERDTTTGLTVEYLFLHVGRYASFQEAIHPMYFDHGNGGFHHSVTGLGVKMYSAMEYENRLICNLCDKAFAPKILFNPTTSEASQKFSLAHMGDFAVMPKGFEVNQTGVAGLMDDGLAMRGQLKDIMNTTLSSYRQGVASQKSGNPVTKFEKQLEAAMQSSLSMPQFNRYYKQLDQLMSEIWRRISNPNSTDERAKEFQSKCRKQGVPIEALNRVEYVGATRVIGQGSAFMRKQAIDAIFPIAAALPEAGRDNLIADKIAAEAGQAAVQRYYPKKNSPLASDQQAEAIQWVAAMKVGVPPVVTSTQNALTYAATFLKAGVDAMTSLQQGGNPMQVLSFLEIDGPAIMGQLRRIANDPTRKQVFHEMMKQWEQLAGATDMLKKKMQQAAEQQQGQQQKTQAAMTDEQIKTAKAQNDIQLKQVKTAAQMQQSHQKFQQKLEQTAQDMALKDAVTAHELTLDQQRLEHDKAMAEKEPAPTEE